MLSSAWSYRSTGLGSYEIRVYAWSVSECLSKFDDVDPEPDSADSVSADDTAAEASTAEASTTEDPIPDNAWDPIAETPDASTFVADSYADEGEF
jgi:hypothetical protein